MRNRIATCIGLVLSVLPIVGCTSVDSNRVRPDQTAEPGGDGPDQTVEPSADQPDPAFIAEVAGAYQSGRFNLVIGEDGGFLQETVPVFEQESGAVVRIDGQHYVRVNSFTCGPGGRSTFGPCDRLLELVDADTIRVGGASWTRGRLCTVYCGDPLIGANGNSSGSQPTIIPCELDDPNISCFGFETRQRFTGTLTGDEVVPVVATAASGYGTFELTDSFEGPAMSLYFAAEGLSSEVTGAHLHLGPSGANGPVVYEAFTNPATGNPNVIEASGFWRLTPDQIEPLLQGGIYADMHTTAYPDGEIRGQLLPLCFRAELSGGQVVPLSGTAGTGLALLTLSLDQTSLRIVLLIGQLSGSVVTATQIHIAQPGENGPMLFDFTDQLDTTLVSSSAISVEVSAIANWPITPSELDALRSGGLYVEVQTDAGPAESLRGQIGLNEGVGCLPSP